MRTKRGGGVKVGPSAPTTTWRSKKQTRTGGKGHAKRGREAGKELRKSRSSRPLPAMRDPRMTGKGLLKTTKPGHQKSGRTLSILWASGKGKNVNKGRTRPGAAATSGSNPNKTRNWGQIKVKPRGRGRIKSIRGDVITEPSINRSRMLKRPNLQKATIAKSTGGELREIWVKVNIEPKTRAWGEGRGSLWGETP